MASTVLRAVLVMTVAGSGLMAQVPTRRQIIRTDSLGRRVDSLGRVLPAPPGRPDARVLDGAGQDTSRAGRGAGLPRRPTRQFQSPDSVVQALLRLEGFRVTRYNADSVTFLAQDREMRLAGRALVEREGSTLEADSVRYTETNCGLFAVGSPRLFDRTGVMVGNGMRYDACNHAGIIADATTDFQESNATWYLRGDFAIDNEEDRFYAAASTITSCDLTDPHYHFAAREVKWISRRIMISRPAVLYVADIPVLWLPFIFQDMRRGRRSGLIPPQFGLNDIVRNSPNYKRHVANLGYYWAIADYADAQVTFDWYAQRFTALNGRVRYRWLDRFIAGGINVQELRESGGSSGASGSSSRRVSWSHQQDFNINTHLTANLDYASSSRVISRNAVDPVLAVATIDSRLNFTRRFTWGQLNVGGSRTQSLDKPQVTMNLPTVQFTPNPIALRQNITWSPSFSLTNSLQRDVGPGNFISVGPGQVDTALTDSRATQVSIATPLRIGRWNWANSISVSDEWSSRRESVTVRDPADTTRLLVRTYSETFQTGVDWNTGIDLPVLFQGSWNLRPSLSIVNTAGGPFLIRNRNTDGGFVSQGKRLQYSAGVSPTLFGLFGGIGPVARVRHSISPSISWAYSPAAEVPEDYARAISRDGRATTRKSDARQTVTFGLSQNFEAKLRPPRRAEADSAPPGGRPEEGRKLRLLSVQSGGITIDIEQAKKPGRTGWVTDSWGNTFSSDLLRGFSLSTTHDLFDGPVGVVGSRFDPTLTSVTMGFSLSPGTLAALGSILGLRVAPDRTRAQADTAAASDSISTRGDFTNAYQRGPLSTRYGALASLGPRGGALGGGFTASVNYSLQRQRPVGPVAGAPVTTTALSQAQSQLNASLSFSPTAHWTVSWQTDYNFTRSEFGSHVLRLDRDLHDWRATFSFVKSPNGNFLFNFFLQLIDQPEIKLEYDQRNLENR